MEINKQMADAIEKQVNRKMKDLQGRRTIGFGAISEHKNREAQLRVGPEVRLQNLSELPREGSTGYHLKTNFNFSKRTIAPVLSPRKFGLLCPSPQKLFLL